MTAIVYTLTNTGTGALTIQSMTFNDPPGIGHTANLLNLGGSSTETGNAALSYSFPPSAVQTFTLDYTNAGAVSGPYTGNVIIGGSNSTSQTINSTITVVGGGTTTTTTLAPSLTTTTTTLAPGLTTTTTTLAPGLTTTTTTLAPSLTTTTTTSAPGTTTTTTSGSGPVSPLGFNGKNYTYSGQSAELRLEIYADGTWQLIPTNSGPTPTTYNDLPSWNTITGNWYSPTTPGIGSGYIYKIILNSETQVNDGLVGTSIPANDWVPFPATSETVAYVSITAAGFDDAEGNFTFQVGQNIITPVILSTSTFTLHGYSGASPATTTTTTTAAPGLTTTTTIAPTTTTTTAAGPLLVFNSLDDFYIDNFNTLANFASLDLNFDDGGNIGTTGQIVVVNSGSTAYLNPITTGAGSGFEIKVSITSGVNGVFTFFTINGVNFENGQTSPYYNLGSGAVLRYLLVDAGNVGLSGTGIGTVYIRNTSTLAEISRGFSITCHTQ